MAFFAALGDATSPTWSRHELRQDNDISVNDVSMDEYEPFSSVTNVQQAVKGLRSSLASFGFATELNLFSGKVEDAVTTANLIDQLLRTLQRSRETQDTLHQLVSKLRVDSQASTNERRRLEEQLAEKFAELGSAEIKLRTTARDHGEVSRKLQLEVDNLKRKNKQLESAMHGMQARLRQKDMEAGGLRQQLSEVLSHRHAGKNTRRPSQGLSSQNLSDGGAAAVTMAQAEAAEASNRMLREHLANVTADFKHLVARCENMNAGVAQSEAGSLGGEGCQEHVLGVSVYVDDQAPEKLVSELAAVQQRCRALLKRQLNARPCQRSEHSNAESETLRSTVRDQDKALTAALARVKRLEAQLEAAQQRAAAAQQRVAILEKRLTAAAQDAVEANAHAGAAEAHAQAAAAQVQVQAAQLEATAKAELRADANQVALEAAVAKCNALEEELVATRAQLAAAHDVAAGQGKELTIIRTQLNVLRRALTVTGRTEQLQQAAIAPALSLGASGIMGATTTQTVIERVPYQASAGAPPPVPTLPLGTIHPTSHACDPCSSPAPTCVTRKQWDVGAAGAVPRASPRELLQAQADGSPSDNNSERDHPASLHIQPPVYNSRLAEALDLLSPAASEVSDEQQVKSVGGSPF